MKLSLLNFKEPPQSIIPDNTEKMPSEIKMLLSQMHERLETQPSPSKPPKKTRPTETRKTEKSSLPDQLNQELLRWGNSLGKAAFISMLEEIPPLLLCADQLGAFEGKSASRLSDALHAMEARFSAKVSHAALTSLFFKSSVTGLLVAQSRSYRNTKAGENNPRQEPFYKRKIREILSESSYYSQYAVVNKMVANGWIQHNSDTDTFRVAEDESGWWRRKEVKVSSMASTISTIRNESRGKLKKN